MQSVNWAWGPSLIALTIAIHVRRRVGIRAWLEAWNLGFRHVILIVIGVDEALDDAEQIEGAARQPVSPRHRHHVAGASLRASCQARAGRRVRPSPSREKSCAPRVTKLLTLGIQRMPPER